MLCSTKQKERHRKTILPSATVSSKVNPVPQVSHSYPSASTAFRFQETMKSTIGPHQKSLSPSVISEALLKPLRTPPASFLLLVPCLLELSKPGLCCATEFLWLEELDSISLGETHAAPLLLEDSS